MHIQVINFNLEGINRAEYEAVCNELAEAFAALPGLISKHWLADDENNTYGGVYIWESKDAYEGYLKSDLFATYYYHIQLLLDVEIQAEKVFLN